MWSTKKKGYTVSPIIALSAGHVGSRGIDRGVIRLEMISGAGLGLKMRSRLGSINKLSLQHASFQPNSINEKRKNRKTDGGI